MTRERASFTFDPIDMLSLQIGFNFVRVACSILETTSGLEPSSETTASMNLKLVTFPSFCPFTLIALRMPFALFVINSVFLALISILYLVQVLSRLSTRAPSSRPYYARASMSSAKPLIAKISAAYANFSVTFFQSVSLPFDKVLYRANDRKYPYNIPTVVLSHFPMLPFI